jgi:hypothetical protein
MGFIALHYYILFILLTIFSMIDITSQQSIMSAPAVILFIGNPLWTWFLHLSSGLFCLIEEPIGLCCQKQLFQRSQFQILMLLLFLLPELFGFRLEDLCYHNGREDTKRHKWFKMPSQLLTFITELTNVIVLKFAWLWAKIECTREHLNWRTFQGCVASRWVQFLAANPRGSAAILFWQWIF